MPSHTVPCVHCDEARQRFERLGYTVHGCDPVPGEPEMCSLRYSPPVEAGAPTVNTADAGLPLLTDSQARAAKAIVNLFETGHVLGDYGQVTLLPGDPGRLTYGRSQTTLGSGKLAELLQQYADNPGARFGARLRPWLPALGRGDAAMDTDGKLHNLLRACADDPVMRETQDRFFDDNFWRPALRTAGKAGIRSALGVAVVYDSLVHGSWGRIRDLTLAELGPATQAGEAPWVARYVALRRQWLAGHSIAILRGTVYRMDAFQRLIALGQWGLVLPLVVRGSEISAASLAAVPPGCYDGPVPGTRALSVTQPLLRGLDVRLLQLALSDLGADIKADGVFGNGAARCLKELQIARGLPVTGVADIGLVGTLAG